MTRRRRVAAAVAVVVVAGAVGVGIVATRSGDGPSSSEADDEAAASTIVTGPPTEEWEALRDDPCRLLVPAGVAGAMRWADVEVAPDESAESTCRYVDVDDPSRAVTVEVLRQQTPESLESRLAGTAEDAGGHRVRLDTPGAGTLVVADGSAVLIALRDGAASDADLAAAVVAIGAATRDVLPDAPYAADAAASGDPCAAVPASALDEDHVTGGDGRDPALCAYRLPDGTLVRFGLLPADGIDLEAATDEADVGIEGAREVVAESDPGGAVTLLAPAPGDAVAKVDITSPARPVDAQRDLAARILGLLAEG